MMMATTTATQRITRLAPLTVPSLKSLPTDKQTFAVHTATEALLALRTEVLVPLVPTKAALWVEVGPFSHTNPGSQEQVIQVEEANRAIIVVADLPCTCLRLMLITEITALQDTMEDLHLVPTIIEEEVTLPMIGEVLLPMATMAAHLRTIGDLQGRIIEDHPLLILLAIVTAMIKAIKEDHLLLIIIAVLLRIQACLLMTTKGVLLHRRVEGTMAHKGNSNQPVETLVGPSLLRLAVAQMKNHMPREGLVMG